MDRNRYLQRINFTDKISVDDQTLIKLHEHHVFNVPFENLDIHYHRFFKLALDSLYQKVVINFRGGFCYELNVMFNALLCDIGFKSSLIATRIFDDLGNLGPPYDHTSIYVDTGKKYLADVGFGDLFIKPLEMREGVQSDGRNLFKIEKFDDQNFMLSMCSDQTNFHPKYTFSLNEVQINEFDEICTDKQTNPLSYFVKNTICTKPTSAGRLTLFNNKLIEKRGNERIEKLIGSDDELRVALKTLFGIEIE